RDYLGALSESAFGRAAEVARHKHQRRLAWYHETAPDRDEKWRDKQLRKLAKQDAAAERFANRAGIVWREKNPDTESKPVSPASVDHSDTESKPVSPASVDHSDTESKQVSPASVYHSDNESKTVDPTSDDHSDTLDNETHETHATSAQDA